MFVNIFGFVAQPALTSFSIPKGNEGIYKWNLVVHCFLIQFIMVEVMKSGELYEHIGPHLG